MITDDEARARLAARHHAADVAERASTLRARCRLLVGVALVLTVVGVVVGVRMAVHAVPNACDDGGPCVSYSHAGEGTAIVVMSVLLLIVVLLIALLISARLGDQEPRSV